MFAVSGGALTATATSTGGDAVAVYYIDQYLPIYYEISAQVYLTKPTAGWKANAYVIFDYFAPDDFKFAGVDQSTNKLVMGRRTAAGWAVDVQSSVAGGVKFNTWYTMFVAVNGTTATVVLDGVAAFTHTFAPRVIDGESVGLNKGFVGMGSNQARGTFDNISVQVLPPAITLDVTETFDGGAGLVSDVVSPAWTAGGGVLTGSAPASAPAVALASIPPLDPNAYLEFTAVVRPGAGARAGVAYDVYDATTYKFVVLDLAAQAVVFGHAAGGARVVDETIARSLVAGTLYTMLLTIKGASVSLALNGTFIRSRAYNAALADGGFGLLVGAGSAGVESVRVRTDSTAAGSGSTVPSEPEPTPPPPPVVPTVSIGSVSVNEGRSGTTAVTLPVTLSAATTSTVTVVVTITGGTATAGSDYTAWSSAVTVTFAPGETSKTVTVSVLGDRTVEPNETVILALSNATGATIGTGTGTLTIVNDDSKLLATAAGSGTTTALTPGDLDAALAEALAIWARAGADAGRSRRDRRVRHADGRPRPRRGGRHHDPPRRRRRRLGLGDRPSPARSRAGWTSSAFWCTRSATSSASTTPTTAPWRSPSPPAPGSRCRRRRCPPRRRRRPPDPARLPAPPPPSPH